MARFLLENIFFLEYIFLCSSSVATHHNLSKLCSGFAAPSVLQKSRSFSPLKMKRLQIERNTPFLLSFILLLLVFVPAKMAAQTPAFPGAEGFGMYVSGGRGGKVYRVTTLEDTGKEGSFRYAVNQKGARTIIFDVAGTIHLKSDLYVRNGDLTIAGQTSPGGICIADYGFGIRTENVIVRFLRIRPGDVCGTEVDGFGGFDHGHFIIDHCSVSWSVDECLTAYANDYTTVQWCLVSQPLNYSVHPKTLYTDGKPHCYGGVWGGDHATFHHNLIAHAVSRTPRFGSRYTMQERGLEDLTDMRNCVVYNWCGVGCYGGSQMKINMVNNYIKPGPATDQHYAGKVQHYRIFAADADVQAYVDGNVVEGHADVSDDNWPKGVAAQMSATAAQKAAARMTEPFDCGNIVTFSAEDAYQQVLAYSGASNYRDKYDSAIIDDVVNRKGSFKSYTAAYSWSGEYEGKQYSVSHPAGWTEPGIINTQRDAVLDGETPPWVNIPYDEEMLMRIKKDSDGDGVPDYYEYRLDMDPTDASDINEVNEEGYTNLELYLNYLVKDITQAQKRVPDFTSVYLEQSQRIGMQGNNLSVVDAPLGSELSVYTLTGEPVLRAAIQGTSHIALSRGIYLVALSSSEGVLTQKVIAR